MQYQRLDSFCSSMLRGSLRKLLRERGANAEREQLQAENNNARFAALVLRLQGCRLWGFCRSSHRCSCLSLKQMCRRSSTANGSQRRLTKSLQFSLPRRTFSGPPWRALPRSRQLHRTSDTFPQKLWQKTRVEIGFKVDVFGFILDYNMSI